MTDGSRDQYSSANNTLLLQTVIAQNKEQSAKLEKMNDKLDMTKEAVTRLQALEIHTRLEGMEKRIQSIELIEQKRSGALGFLAWLQSSFPFFLAAGAAIMSFFAYFKTPTGH